MQPFCQRQVHRAASALLLIGALFLSLAAPAAQTQRQNIIDTVDFETGDLSQPRGLEPCGDKFANSPCANSIRIVTAPARAGNYAARFYLDKTHERSEISADYAPINTVLWYGWSLYIPADFVSDTSSSLDFVSQWHQRNDRSWYDAAPSNLQISNGNWRFSLKYQPNPSVQSITSFGRDLVSISGDKGKWTDWVMQVKWSYRSDGFLRLYKDGKRIWSYDGPTYWDVPDGPYFKMGLYKGDPDWPGPSPRIVYGDEYRMGNSQATYEDVAPSPATPSSVSASASDGTNVPANTLDDNLDTRWSAQGDGQWIRYDLGSTKTVRYLRAAWYQGNLRTARFDLQVSTSGTSWTTVFSGTSSGTSLQQETYNFAARSARYVRIVGHGNSGNDWNSITEVDIYAF